MIVVKDNYVFPVTNEHDWVYIGSYIESYNEVYHCFIKSVAEKTTYNFT